MESFIIGFCLSTLWSVFLVPIFLVKTAFRMPTDT